MLIELPAGSSPERADLLSDYQSVTDVPVEDRMLQQLVNPVCIIENSGNDAELARDLAEVFQSSSVDLARELCKAVAEEDWETVARAAHSFKSPLSFFGANSSVEIAQSLESQTDAGQNDAAPNLVDRLLADVERVKSELLQTDFDHLDLTR